MQIVIIVEDNGSSNVKQIHYIAEEKDNEKLLDYPWVMVGELRVKFNNDARYVYHQVPMKHVVEILMSESYGATFNSLIVKGGFGYEKI
jgi:hypothetical protein